MIVIIISQYCNCEVHEAGIFSVRTIVPATDKVGIIIESIDKKSTSILKFRLELYTLLAKITSLISIVAA